jgi:hypothetical protein
MLWNQRTFKTSKHNTYIYNILALAIILCGSEVWTIRKYGMSRMKTTEIKLFRRIAGHTTLDMKRNNDMLEELGNKIHIHANFIDLTIYKKIYSMPVFIPVFNFQFKHFWPHVRRQFGTVLK